MKLIHQWKKLETLILDNKEFENMNMSKLAQSVDIHAEHNEIMEQITFGNLIQRWKERMGVIIEIGQRQPHDTEDSDEEWNRGMLLGFQSRKVIQVLCIPELIKGFQKKLLEQDNPLMLDFYQRRIDLCKKAIENGQDEHCADGQNRIRHIVRVFSPDSTVPILLHDSMEWSQTVTDANGTKETLKVDLRNKSMSELPDAIKERILSFHTNILKTTTQNDVLIGQMFYDDNSAKPAPPSARVGVLARSPIKSQLETFELEKDEKSLQCGRKYRKFSDWSAMDYLKNRLGAVADNRSVWSRDANGFQTFLLNIVCRLFGDDFGQVGHGLQRSVVFVNDGFKKCSPVLTDKDAELTREHYDLAVTIFQSMAVAFDSEIQPLDKDGNNWEGTFTLGNIINMALFVELLIHDSAFQKYDVLDYDNLMVEMHRFDKKYQDETKYETWSERDYRDNLIDKNEIGTRKYKLIDKKVPYLNKKKQRVYLERLDGYAAANGSQQNFRSASLQYRSECILTWAEEQKISWIKKGWIDEKIERVKSPIVIRQLWEEQDGICALSEKEITETQLFTDDVDVDYDGNKYGQLVLTDALHVHTLDNLLIPTV